jgi:short-subunit dehydrogenase
MIDISYIFLAGASRGVGREIAHCLTEKQLKLKALLRTEAARAELEAMGIKVVLGDALNVGAKVRTSNRQWSSDGRSKNRWHNSSS